MGPPLPPTGIAEGRPPPPGADPISRLSLGGVLRRRRPGPGPGRRLGLGGGVRHDTVAPGKFFPMGKVRARLSAAIEALSTLLQRLVDSPCFHGTEDPISAACAKGGCRRLTRLVG